MRVPCRTALAVLLSLLQLDSVIGGYLITTPRKWTAGSQAQICLTVSPDSASDQDEIKIKVFTQDQPRNHFGGGFWGRPQEPQEEITAKELIPEKVLKPHADMSVTCDQISVPFTQHEFGRIELTGTLGGAAINESKEITFSTNVAETFIQTDKYLYKAGQKVQFRVLTLQGPFFKVSTDAYPEIIVETPSGSRIAQWLNVSNPSGLIHLDLQLIDEPEEGVYQIKAKSPGTGETVSKTFKIEDYVLPRFEVTVKPPKYLLADDKLLKFEVCATYTFGQPVRGNVSTTLSNNAWGRRKIDLNLDDQLFGCKTIEVPLRSFNINSRDYFVYSISIKVKVTEEGTGNTAEEKSSVDITRTVLTMDTVETQTYQKPELPYVTSVKASFPDGSPAALEPMSVCVNEDCRNMTTNDQGVLKFALPPHLQTTNPAVTSLNYPRKTLPGGSYPRTYMYESSYRPYASKYYSPTNSSLIISPETTTLQCQPGQAISLTIPVMFSATNVSEALLYVQVVSRGQIQYWKSETVSLAAGELPVDDSILVAPMQPTASPFTVRGTLQLAVELPPTVSPTVRVVVWYSRPDGEVVSDARELKLGKCLEHSVGLSWATARAEQGTPVPLTMTAEPSSLCSLGIVDKSVELLGASQDSLTLDKVFELAERTAISPWTNSQIDDYTYCRKKNPAPEIPDEGIPPGPIPIPFVPATEEIPMDAPATELPAEPATDAPSTDAGAAEAKPLPAQLEKERTKRSIVPFYRYNTEFVDALKMFDESGLYIISDLTYETRPCTRYEGCPTCRIVGGAGGGAGFGGGEIAFAAVPQSFAGSPQFDSASEDGGQTQSVSNENVEPRTYFPETWLWELSTVQESGTSVQELTLPNTVTEWVGRAVCVHPSKGLGISPPARVTAFTPFFIDLTVLPTVKKGEVMPVIISVFNYLDDSLPVRITLEASPEYEILGAEGPEAVTVQEKAGVRAACIPKGDKETVTVRIRPLVVGDVNVTVSAVADTSYPEQCGSGADVTKVDKIISPIIVEYEGFPREKTWTKYMCSEDLNENLDFFDEWLLEAPAEIVPESERAWVTVVGDLLGPTLENLGNLIKMPYGCGEQNMLNFAPNIFVLQYLEASNQANEAVAEKITRFMKSGYQRELNYKHRDGSYSAFGESDDSGSTWLTAFVVKSFAQARQYIDVDATELAMSTDWLKNRQLENGCFESVGKVLHKDMKGGLSEGGSPGVLSAYVMAALLEAGEDPTSKAVASAVFCLEAAGKETPGPYYAALKAYALSLARLPEADLAISNLLGMAVDSPTGLYWELPATANSHSQSESAVSPVAVETAGYALLALMSRDPELYSTHGHRLVKWISGQRNSQGGFISTQDTVVALQALAAYESYQSQEPLDLSVTVTGEGVAAHFKLVESNKLLSQRAEVPKVPTKLVLDMAGTGCTLVQAVVRYNIRDPEPSEAFSISVSTSLDHDSCKSSTIRACASYLLNDDASNMAVIEVGLVSGYIPDKKDLKHIVGYGTGIIKRYEVDGNKVLFYVDQFTAKETCVQFSAIEEVKVENAKPGTVKVYDYYQPEFAISSNYEFPRQWFCNVGPVRPPVEDDIIVEDIIVEDEEVVSTTPANPAVDDLLGALDGLP